MVLFQTLVSNSCAPSRLVSVLDGVSSPNGGSRTSCPTCGPRQQRDGNQGSTGTRSRAAIPQGVHQATQPSIMPIAARLPTVRSLYRYKPHNVNCCHLQHGLIGRGAVKTVYKGFDCVEGREVSALKADFHTQPFNGRLKHLM